MLQRREQHRLTLVAIRGQREKKSPIPIGFLLRAPGQPLPGVTRRDARRRLAAPGVPRHMPAAIITSIIPPYEVLLHVHAGKIGMANRIKFVAHVAARVV